MDLKSELSGASHTSFSLLFPPGWKRFAIDDEAEKIFVNNLGEVFKPRGQARELVHYRAMTHKLFLELKKKRASAIYIPVKPIGEVILPASIVIMPAPVRSPQQLEAFRQQVAERFALATTTVDGLAVWRWEERREAQPGDAEGVYGVTVHHLFEAPRSSGRPPALVSATLLMPVGHEGDEYAEGALELLDAIAGTYSWTEAT